MPNILTNVHGGIINDQMMQGSVQYYQMTLTGAFQYTISNGAVVIPSFLAFGGTANIVGDKKPVPNSAAELAFEVIAQKCTLVQIAIISNDVIQFAVENTSNGWASATDMQTALIALASKNVPNASAAGQTVDFSTINVVAKEFVLKS